MQQEHRANTDLARLSGTYIISDALSTTTWLSIDIKDSLSTMYSVHTYYCHLYLHTSKYWSHRVWMHDSWTFFPLCSILYGFNLANTAHILNNREKSNSQCTEYNNSKCVTLLSSSHIIIAYFSVLPLLLPPTLFLFLFLTLHPFQYCFTNYFIRFPSNPISHSRISILEGY